MPPHRFPRNKKSLVRKRDEATVVPPRFCLPQIMQYTLNDFIAVNGLPTWAMMHYLFNKLLLDDNK